MTCDVLRVMRDTWRFVACTDERQLSDAAIEDLADHLFALAGKQSSAAAADAAAAAAADADANADATTAAAVPSTTHTAPSIPPPCPPDSIFGLSSRGFIKSHFYILMVTVLRIR